MYECKLCNICTSLKTDFKRHNITKKHINKVKMEEGLGLNIKNHKNESKMNPNESKMNPNESKMNPESKMKYECKQCYRKYSTNSNLHKHLKKCTINKDKIVSILNSNEELSDAKLLDYIKLIEKENKLITKEKKAMWKEIEKLIDTVGTSTTNNIMNNTINIVAPNNFTQENLDYLTGDYLDGLLKIPYGSILNLLRYVHFNPNHPENHNIKIPNRKEKFAVVYNKGKWEIRVKKDVIGDMVETAYNIIDCHYDEVKNTLEFGRKERFTNYQISYDTDNKTRQKIKTDVELVILNGNDGETGKLMSN